jgi:N-acetylneuraminate synthase/N,N'-diacetyllegionaminate synthase
MLECESLRRDRVPYLRWQLPVRQQPVCLPMTYIIAEQGSVADGSLGNALRLIEECAKAGADATKLQDHRFEKIKGDPPWFTGVGEQRGDYLKRTSFNQEQWREIREAATFWNVDLIVSPFSVEAVRLLEELPVDA